MVKTNTTPLANRDIYQFLIILAGLFTFILFGCFLQVFENLKASNLISPDTKSYWVSAKNLYYSFEPHYIRPLGYPLLIGLPLIFTDDFLVLNFFAATLNLFLWLFTLLLVYHSLRMWLSPKVCFLLTLPLVLSTGSLAIIPFTLTETTYALLLTLIAFYLLRFHKTKTFNYLIAATSAGIFTIVVKPGFFYLAVALFIYFIYHLFYHFRQVGFRQMILLAFSVSLLLLQLGLMKDKYNKPVTSFIANITWYKYLSAQVDAELLNITLTESKELKKKQSTGSIVEQDKIFRDDLKNKFSNYPRLVFKHMVNNILVNLTAKSTLLLAYSNLQVNENFKNRQEFLYSFSGYYNRFFAGIIVIISLLMMVKLKAFWIEPLAILGIVLYNTLTSGISHWQGDRFSLVVYPLILILAGIVCSEFLSKKKVRSPEPH